MSKTRSPPILSARQIIHKSQKISCDNIADTLGSLKLAHCHIHASNDREAACGWDSFLVERIQHEFFWHSIHYLGPEKSRKIPARFPSPKNKKFTDELQARTQSAGGRQQKQSKKCSESADIFHPIFLRILGVCFSHLFLKFSSAVVLNAVEHTNTQVSAKECKWAQKSANASTQKRCRRA